MVWVEFFFVRHGESEHNAAGLFCGSVDSPLTAAGAAQADRVAQQLTGVAVDWVVSSPQQRALCTAQRIAAGRGIAVEVDARFAEHTKGVLEGTPHRRVRSVEWATVPGAESMREFFERVSAALAEWAGRGGVGVVVSHAGVARAIECLRVGGDPDLLYDTAKVGNAEPYRVVLFPTSPSVR